MLKAVDRIISLKERIRQIEWVARRQTGKTTLTKTWQNGARACALAGVEPEGSTKCILQYMYTWLERMYSRFKPSTV